MPLLILFLLILVLYLTKKKYYKSLKIIDLAIPATDFVRLILHDIQIVFPCDRPYKLELRYYETKKVMGRYFFDSDKIVIYLSKCSTLLEITDTVIHEYCHHLQNHLDNKVIEYALELYDQQYENHPWELEARKFAASNRQRILKNLINKPYE